MNSVTSCVILFFNTEVTEYCGLIISTTSNDVVVELLQKRFSHTVAANHFFQWSTLTQTQQNTRPAPHTGFCDVPLLPYK